MALRHGSLDAWHLKIEIQQKGRKKDSELKSFSSFQNPRHLFEGFHPLQPGYLRKLADLKGSTKFGPCGCRNSRGVL